MLFGLSNTDKTNAFSPGRPSLRVPALAAASDSEIDQMTVPMLKDELRSHGLKVSGLKQELRERLQSDLDQLPVEPPVEPTEPPVERVEPPAELPAAASGSDSVSRRK